MIKIIYLFLPILFLIGCQKPLKNIEDYTPTIEMSAQVLDDGTVLVKGTFLTYGAGYLDKIGFNYSLDENSEISENQILMAADNDFEYIFPDIFHPDSTYYFKAFATNGYGYTITKALKINDIKAKPVTAPCSIPLNRHIAGINNQQIIGFSGAVNSFDYVEYDYTISQLHVYFKFRYPPKTGVYKTTTYLDPQDYNKKEVHIHGGWQSFHVKEGAEVYINRISADSFKVEICNAIVPVNNIDQIYQSHFISPY